MKTVSLNDHNENNCIPKKITETIIIHTNENIKMEVFVNCLAFLYIISEQNGFLTIVQMAMNNMANNLSDGFFRIS